MHHDDPRRQSCKVCGARDKFDFHVPDDVWTAVVPPEYRTLAVCLACFDDFACERGVDYAGRIDGIWFAGDRATMEVAVIRAVTVDAADLLG